MAMLIIHGMQGPDTPVKIETTDAVLDRVADLLEHPVTEAGGFWLAGQFDVQRNGELTYPDPGVGHQRLWIPPTALVHLAYDRGLHPDPDRVVDSDHVVLI